MLVVTLAATVKGNRIDLIIKHQIIINNQYAASYNKLGTSKIDTLTWLLDPYVLAILFFPEEFFRKCQMVFRRKMEDT